MKKSVVLLTISICFSFFINAQNITIIHTGTLLDTPGDDPKNNRSIIIENGIIKDVKKGFVSAKDLDLTETDVAIIDLKNKFVLPGLIDLHTHITKEREPGKNPHEWTTLNDEDYAFRAVPYLKRTLHAGFTTVRNLGADPNLINAAKRSVNMGVVEGPRIIASTGAVSPTGGHADFHGYRHEILEAVDKRVGICNGPDDCSRAVRDLVKQGADVIKITATGGVLSNTNAGVGQQLTDDELRSIVETAHSLGRKVAAHAHEAEGVNAALRAGVNSIEHGSYLNDESIKLFLEKDAYLVPTLLAGVSVAEELKINKNIPANVAEKILQVAPVVEASFKKALKAKVKIAFGTDSGVSKHGTNAREFEIMVAYGMDENEAIKSATVTASELLGMSEKLGTIETGKIADIIAVGGSPLENISTLMHVTFVMKAGIVYKK
ncbi:amidohydrolase family protein [Seonamhaeicola sp.]|uniref:metal-dependent hydrolase family protein n=1 Tax=Seonamhaeicola sp. TaxID=1912245 RepID=UPI00260744B8|nr:amidohydrolase family protein [Seonamhaeicola sp.]